MATEAYRRLGDAALLDSLRSCVANERRSIVKVLQRLAEVDRRRLYSKRFHYATLFTFARRELGYSEDAAWYRVAVAQAAARFPILYRRLAKGRLALTVAAMIAKHLRADNYRELLDRCEGLSRREIERIIAEIEPQRSEPRERVRFIQVAAPTPAASASPEGDALPLMSEGESRAQEARIAAAPSDDSGQQQGSAEASEVARVEISRSMSGSSGVSNAPRRCCATNIRRGASPRCSRTRWTLCWRGSIRSVAARAGGNGRNARCVRGSRLRRVRNRNDPRRSADAESRRESGRKSGAATEAAAPSSAPTAAAAEIVRSPYFLTRPSAAPAPMSTTIATSRRISVILEV